MNNNSRYQEIFSLSVRALSEKYNGEQSRKIVEQAVKAIKGMKNEGTINSKIYLSASNSKTPMEILQILINCAEIGVSLPMLERCKQMLIDAGGVIPEEEARLIGVKAAVVGAIGGAALGEITGEIIRGVMERETGKAIVEVAVEREIVEVIKATIIIGGAIVGGEIGGTIGTRAVTVKKVLRGLLIGLGIGSAIGGAIKGVIEGETGEGIRVPAIIGGAMVGGAIGGAMERGIKGALVGALVGVNAFYLNSLSPKSNLISPMFEKYTQENILYITQ